MLSSSKMAVILERQKESGLSVKSFCTNEGIAPSTFFYWQKKLRTEGPGGRVIGKQKCSENGNCNAVKTGTGIQ